jgi:hypothetical protein
MTREEILDKVQDIEITPIRSDSDPLVNAQLRIARAICLVVRAILVKQ